MSENVPPEKEKLKANMKYPESFIKTAGASIYGNALYRKENDGTFTEVSDQVNAENYWPWGLSVGDLNADGFVDASNANRLGGKKKVDSPSTAGEDHIMACCLQDWASDQTCIMMCG